MKKRILIPIVAVLIISAMTVGVSYAFLASKSHRIENTFVAGEISLTLTETTGSNYVLVPGNKVSKNPRITVEKGSEECWLFFKEERQGLPDDIISYTYEDGWNALDGEEGVYWRRVSESAMDKTYGILKGNSFNVSYDVTEERLASLGGESRLVYLAYAVQYDGISTPEKAWEILQSRGHDR